LSSPGDSGRKEVDLRWNFGYDFSALYFTTGSDTTMITMRLMRFGAKKKPTYRIVVMDSEKARQSQALDTIGSYNPLKEPAEISIDIAKANLWLSKGVQPSRTVQSLLDKASASTK
jgi:small subunit ribosomal protein S16